MLGHFSTGFTLDICARVTMAAQEEATDIIGNVPVLQRTGSNIDKITGICYHINSF